MSEHKHECGCGCGCGHDHHHEEACGCGCGHEEGCGCGTDVAFEDGERKFITLELEDGTTQEFMVFEIFEACNHKTYIALIPEQAVGTEDAEVFLYHFSEDANGDPILNVITDEDELEIACDAFDEILDEIEYNEMLAHDED